MIEHDVMVGSNRPIRLKFDGDQFWYSFDGQEYHDPRERGQFPTLANFLNNKELNGFLDAVAEKSYSPSVGQTFPTNVYWGDTHVHTSFSSDAWSSWGRLRPEQAYRLAKGETVTGESGHQLRLRRPLDFLMVADHASNIGYVARIAAGDEDLLSTEAGQRTAEVLKSFL